MTTELTLEERVSIAEAAARDLLKTVRRAEGDKELAVRSHHWWLTNYGRKREAEFARLRDIEIVARAYVIADARYQRRIDTADIRTALAVTPIPIPEWDDD